MVRREYGMGARVFDDGEQTVVTERGLGECAGATDGLTMRFAEQVRGHHPLVGVLEQGQFRSPCPTEGRGVADNLVEVLIGERTRQPQRVGEVERTCFRRFSRLCGHVERRMKDRVRPS